MANGHFKIHAIWTCWFSNLFLLLSFLVTSEPESNPVALCDDVLDTKRISTFGNFTSSNLKATLHLMNLMHIRRTCVRLESSSFTESSIFQCDFPQHCAGELNAHAKCIKFKVISVFACARLRAHNSHTLTPLLNSFFLLTSTLWWNYFNISNTSRNFTRVFDTPFHQPKTISQIIPWPSASIRSARISSGLFFGCPIKLLRIIDFDLAFESIQH